MYFSVCRLRFFHLLSHMRVVIMRPYFQPCYEIIMYSFDTEVMHGGDAVLNLDTVDRIEFWILKQVTCFRVSCLNPALAGHPERMLFRCRYRYSFDRNSVRLGLPFEQFHNRIIGVYWSQIRRNR